MNNEGKNHKISILSYIQELQEVQDFIDDISLKIENEDDKYSQALNYLQRRKQSLQYEIQQHAEYSQEYYKERLQGIENLIEQENKKITELEESEAIKGINPEILIQEVIGGEESEKRDLFISKCVIEDLTEFAKYIEEEIQYFQSINVRYDEKQDREDKAKDIFHSYEEEMEIIENIAGNFDNNNDEKIRRYLNQRKYSIYYNVQNIIDEELEKYTGELEEINSLIANDSEKVTKLEEKIVREGDLNDDEKMDHIISKGDIENLLKLKVNIIERIGFLKSIDIYKDGLPNIEKKADTDKEDKKTSMDDSEKLEEDDDLVQKVPKDNEELSQGDTFLIVSKPAGRFGFIKNAWNRIRERLTKKSEKNEISNDTDNEKTDEKPKKETLRERLGGYNESQYKFEKQAMSELEKKKQLNNETARKVEQQYGD